MQFTCTCNTGSYTAIQSSPLVMTLVIMSTMLQLCDNVVTILLQPGHNLVNITGFFISELHCKNTKLYNRPTQLMYAMM